MAGRHPDLPRRVRNSSRKGSSFLVGSTDRPVNRSLECPPSHRGHQTQDPTPVRVPQPGSSGQLVVRAEPLLRRPPPYTDSFAEREAATYEMDTHPRCRLPAEASELDPKPRPLPAQLSGEPWEYLPPAIRGRHAFLQPSPRHHTCLHLRSPVVAESRTGLLGGCVS